MKAGIVQALFGIAAARSMAGVRLLLTSDEEIGSGSSRDTIQEIARQVTSALVVEPSFDGHLKTGRKGLSVYHLEISGRAAHPGLEPEAGASALSEAAHRVFAAERLSDVAVGTSVLATLVRGGSAANVVPARAEVTFDVRALSPEEQDRVDKAVRSQEPTVPGVTTVVSGGINRPPLEPARSKHLFDVACVANEGLGLGALQGRTVGGASDGNLTAAVGTPTLDGLGAVGGQAHSEGEWVNVAAMPERAALLAELIDHLGSGG